MRYRIVLSVLIASGVAIACSDATKPPQLGGLKQKIVAGKSQSFVATLNQPSTSVLDFVYRERVAMYERPSLMKRLLLPAVAYAQSSVTVTAQPNSIVCVGEDQTDLIPFSRCVNTDAEGHSRFDFPKLPTKTGTYRAKFNAVYGQEASTLDSVIITVTPAALDTEYRMQSIPIQTSPAVFPEDGVRDKFGNGIQYRIIGDARLTASDTTVGTLGARTVTWSQAQTHGSRFVLELRGTSNALVGRLYYSVGADDRITWTACGIAIATNSC